MITLTYSEQDSANTRALLAALEEIAKPAPKVCWRNVYQSADGRQWVGRNDCATPLEAEERASVVKSVGWSRRIARLKITERAA